jgi:phage tail-like protein
MAAGERRDPYRGYNFLIEIEGSTRAGFSECSGLEVDIDPIEYREGSEGPAVRKLMGLRKYTIISLKRGSTGDVALWQWYNKAVAGQVERKNGAVIRRDDTGAETMRWNFREAWPMKMGGAELQCHRK